MKRALQSLVMLIGIFPCLSFAMKGATKSVEKPISESSAIVQAIDQDDSSFVQAFLQNHSPTLRIQNKVRESLLERAAAHASVQSYSLLLKTALSSDSHVKLSDSRGTPLILSLASLAMPGKEQTAQYEEMISLLLKLDPESASLKDHAYVGDGRTALHEASALGNLHVMNLLLAAKVDVNAKNSSGETPLHLAARFGHLEAVKYLIRSGAQVNPKSKFTQSTPLMAAAEMGHAEVIHELMLSGAHKDEKDTFGKTAPQRYRERLAFYSNSGKKTD